MHSRRHTRSNLTFKRAGSGGSFDDDDDNGKSMSYSKLLVYVLFFFGGVVCFALGSQVFSSDAPSKTTFRTPELPSFGNHQLPLPSVKIPSVNYEDFPDINMKDVHAKALELLKPHDDAEEDDEREREKQQKEEEEEEEKFIKEQALQDAERAAEKKQVSVIDKKQKHSDSVQLSHSNLIDESLALATEQINDLRVMKYESHIIMESNAFAQERIRVAQTSIRKYLTLKYGPGPYYVKMLLRFPDSMMTEGSQGGLKGSRKSEPLREEEIIIEMAPIDYVPYSVYMFLEKIVNGYKSGAFHRNAGHVLQAMVTVQDSNKRNVHEKFAWQEYSPHYPHEKYTLGYAGRPSSNGAFYISTQDNVRNHGPASQGSKSEADSIIGRIHRGEDVVHRMCLQPNRGGNGFIKSPEDYITILSLDLITQM